MGAAKISYPSRTKLGDIFKVLAQVETVDFSRFLFGNWRAEIISAELFEFMGSEDFYISSFPFCLQLELGVNDTGQARRYFECTGYQLLGWSNYLVEEHDFKISLMDGTGALMQIEFREDQECFVNSDDDELHWIFEEIGERIWSGRHLNT